MFEKLKQAELEYNNTSQQVEVNRKIDAMLKRYDIVPKRVMTSKPN